MARRDYIPWWFWPIWIAGLLGSLTLFVLLIWGIVELVPPLVGWLERN